MQRFQTLFYVFCVRIWHPIVFFHASKAFINLIERPHVQISNSTPKLPLFVKEIYAYRSDHNLAIFLKKQNNVETQPSFDRDLTVTKLAKHYLFIEVDVLGKVYLPCSLGWTSSIQKLVTPMVHCTFNSQRQRSHFIEILFQHSFIPLDCVIWIRKVAKEFLDCIWELRTIASPLSHIFFPIFRCSMFVWFLPWHLHFVFLTVLVDFRVRFPLFRLLIGFLLRGRLSRFILRFVSTSWTLPKGVIKKAKWVLIVVKFKHFLPFDRLFQLAGQFSL